MAYKGPRVCPAFPSNLISYLFHLQLSIHTSLLFLQPSATSGPLYLLCSLPGTLKPSVLSLVAFFSSFRSQWLSLPHQLAPPSFL